ncbi:MAG: hypothetical protein IKN12_05990 [Selenomonadaceae bacterium]|nr:hypothetical protein [Selenomonadaceae bacterium]MBR3722302.1 hypothetical protein [Selenomonadaceae bacterium]
MFMTVEGHFNGEKIVLNENINLTYGQKVMVIVLPEKNVKKKIDYAKYRLGEETNFPADVEGYIREMRDNDRF